MIRAWKKVSFNLLLAVLAALFALVMTTSVADASNPTTVSFQGKVVNADGTNVTDGSYGFTFKLYSVSSGGSAVWTESDTLTVTAGVFQVNLGANCPFFTSNACNGSTPIDFSASNSLYLGITFNSDPAGEMTPRVQLQSVPYSFYADNAGSLGGRAASGYVQLSPGSAQSGFINIAGGNTLINATGSNNTTIGGSSGTLTLGGSSAGAITLQSASSFSLTGAAASTISTGATTLAVTSSKWSVDTNGKFSIGTIGSAVATFLVDAGNNTNGGVDYAVHNNSSGTNAFDGFAAYNDNAGASTHYALFGIGGTGYTGLSLLQNSAFILAGAGTSGLVLNTQAALPIIFAINNTQAAQFDSSGNLEVGTSATATARLVVQGADATSSTAALNITNSTPTSILYARDDGKVSVGNTSPSGQFNVGASNQFQVDSNGNITGVATAVGGVTSTSNGTSGLGTSTSLTLTSAASFTVGDYVQVNSANCGGTGINPCYAKITAKATNTLTITPALTWANGATVNEYIFPEIGGNETVTPTLLNRYGRAWFISGVATGNGTTYYNEDGISTSLPVYNIAADSASGATTVNIGNSSTTTITLGTSGTTTNIAGSLATTNNGNISAGSGALQGGSLSISSGAFAVNSSGAITAATGITTSGTVILSGLNHTGVVHTSATGQLSSSAVVLGTDTSGNYVASLGTLTGLSASASSGVGISPNLAVLYGATANTAVQGNTTITVTAGTGLSGGGSYTLGSGGTQTLTVQYGSTAGTAVQGNVQFTCPAAGTNLSGGGTTITEGTGGTCASLAVVASPSFGGTVTAATGLVATTGGLTVSAGGAAITGDISSTGRYYASHATSTNGQGYFVRNGSSTPIASFQGLDTGTNSFGFFGVNKYYNGTAWVDDGQSRLGSSFQIQDDSFNYYSFDTAANFTSRFVVAHGGNVGIGSNVTPGFLLDVQGGDINTSANVRTGGTIRIDSSGNHVNAGNYTGAGAVTLDSASGTALNIGTGASARTLTIGNNTGATGLVVNTGTAGATFNLVAGGQLLVQSASAPTVDNLHIATSGVTTAGINGLSVTYSGGAAAVEAAAERIDLQPGTTSGGTWSAVRLVPNATGAVSGVTENGLKVDNLTTPGSGTENALFVGTGWDNVLKATNSSITQAGLLTATTINATTAYQANGTAGITVAACTAGQYIGNGVAVNEGLITAGSCRTDATGLSDQRVKTNIVSLDSSALDTIKQVNAVNFNYDCSNPYFQQSSTDCDTRLQTGVIAQQLQQIYPNLVYTDDWGYFHVDYQGLSIETLKATTQIAQHINSAGDANFSSVLSPELLSSGGLQISSGSVGDVSIDTGSAASIDIGTTNAQQVNIGNAGSTTTVTGALIATGPTTTSGSVKMNFSDSSTNLTIDNNGSAATNTAALQINDTSGKGYSDLIKTPHFTVDGSGNITADGSIVDKGGSFQLLDPSANAVVSFDASGNANFAGNLQLNSATLNGDLSVAGDANFAGLSNFQKLATFFAKTIFRQDVEFDGHITVSKDTAGYAKLRSGETTVHVSFTAPYADAPIVTVSYSDGQFGLVSAQNITASGFDVTVPTAVTVDSTFSWTAIGAINPQTATNPPPTSP